LLWEIRTKYGGEELLHGEEAARREREWDCGGDFS